MRLADRLALTWAIVLLAAAPAVEPAEGPAAAPSWLPASSSAAAWAPASVPAASPPISGEAQAALLKQLLARSALNGYSSESTAPVTVYGAFWGNLQPPSPAGPEATAKAFLASYGALLGFPAAWATAQDFKVLDGLAMPVASTDKLGLVTSAQDLAVLRKTTGGAGPHILCCPLITGIPYTAATLSLAYDSAGTLVFIAGRYRSPAGVAADGVSPDTAVQAAIAQIARRHPGAAPTGDGQVDAFLEDERDGLAHRHYRVSLVVGDGHHQRQVLVGGNGQVLGEELGDREATGTVYQDYPSQDTCERTLEDMEPGRLLGMTFYTPQLGTHFVSASSAGVKAFSKDGTFSDPPKTEESDWLTWLPWKGKHSNPPFLEINVYDKLTQARASAIGWGAAEVDDHPVRYDVWQGPDGPGAARDNAYFLSADFSLRFARENPVARHNPANDASVVWHEYGHYIEAVVNPTFADGASDDAQSHEVYAMGEGFADAFASLVARNPDLFINWNGSPMRTSANTAHYPESATDEIHSAGMIFSGLCWDLRQKLGDQVAPPLVLDGIRNARAPVTFRNAALGIVGADFQRYAGAHAADILAVLGRRGLDVTQPPPVMNAPSSPLTPLTTDIPSTPPTTGTTGS